MNRLFEIYFVSCLGKTAGHRSLQSSQGLLSNQQIKNIILFIIAFFVLFNIPLWALSYCPRCNFRIGASFSKCPKCLLNLDTDKSQLKPVKSTITVRNGYDAFIRHPHANNRAYKANKNAGGDKTGEIGVWGGPCNLRYLVDFNIESAMDDSDIDYTTFSPKKAYIFVTALPKKTEIEIPVVVFPLTRFFTPGTDKFRVRENKPNGCTWYNATTAMPWKSEGGDFDKNCISHGIIKSGKRNAIDVTEVVKYFFEKSKKENKWNSPGFIIMSDPANREVTSCFVTIYSLEASNYLVRPELFIQ